MNAWLDGRYLGTFSKPFAGQPWCLSPVVPVQGHRVVIYAETADHGDSVKCDVFFDGRSLVDGHVIESLAARKTAVEEKDRAYLSPSDPVQLSRLAVQQSTWIMPGSIAVRLLANAGAMSPGVGVLLAVYCLFVWSFAWWLARGLKTITATDSRRGLKAMVAPLVCYVMEICAGVAIVGLGQ